MCQYFLYPVAVLENKTFVFILLIPLHHYQIVHPFYVDKIDPKFKQLIISKIPSNRLGTPDDVANVTAFLSSDLANYITGENIILDGGWTNY